MVKKMSKIDEAIKKITLECKGKDQLIPIEEYLSKICVDNNTAEKILNPSKSLEGAFKSMEDVARKRQKNGFAYIPPEEAYEIINKYFEIGEVPVSKETAEEEEQGEQGEIIDIMDLL